MTQYNIIMEQPESTVIAEYVPEWGDKPTAYQSEATAFITGINS